MGGGRRHARRLGGGGDLMSQARELRRQLTRKEEDLVTTFRKREMQLEEELHRVKGQVADRSRTGLGGAVLGGGVLFFL